MTTEATGIPPRLESEVLSKAGDGWTTRRTAAWLLTEHGVTVTHHTVARLLREHRSERADTAKTIVREKLGKTLTADLDRLEKHAAKLDRMADTLDHDPELYCKAVEQLVDKTIRTSGCGSKYSTSNGDHSNRLIPSHRKTIWPRMR